MSNFVRVCDDGYSHSRGIYECLSISRISSFVIIAIDISSINIFTNLLVF